MKYNHYYWKKENNEHHGENDAEEVNIDKTMQTPVDCVKDFGFYLKINGKSLEYFNEKNYMVIFLFCKGHFACNRQNR